MVTLGGAYNSRKRLPLGLTSFDIAVGGKLERGEVGLYTRQGVLVYGLTKVGKTTITTSLAARVATQLDSDIAFARVDTFDEQTFKDILEFNGFERYVELVLEDSDEQTVEGLYKMYASNDTDFHVSVLDSAWAISPVAEMESQSGDRNVAQRANVLNPWSAKMHHGTIRAEKEKIWFVTNHILQTIGGRFVGTYIPGGRKLPGVTSLHIKIEQGYIGNSPIKYDTGRLIKGTVVNNNFGRSGGEFNLFVLGGYGIHTGLTAIFDCLTFGYAKLGPSIILNGEKVRSLKTYLNGWEDASLFTPFIETLQNNYQEILDVHFLGKRAKKGSKAERVVVEQEDDTLDGMDANELFNG